MEIAVASPSAAAPSESLLYSSDHSLSNNTSHQMDVTEVTPDLDNSVAASTPPTPATPVGRPRRAAATAANERMQLRPPKSTTKPNPERLPSPASPPNPEDPASDEDSQSPVRKRRKVRKTDPTFTTNGSDTSQEVTVSALKARERKAIFRTPLVARKKKPLSMVPGNRAKVAHGDSSALRSLCGLLRLDDTAEGKMKIEELVDSWVEVYKADRLTGYLELANFFVHAAGCPGKITYAMSTFEHAEIIKQLTAKFDEEGNDYPIVKSGPEFRKFRTDFCKLIETFVKTIKDSIMYDDYLVDTLIRFLCEMSDSGVRAFRHTASLGALKLMTAMVEAAAELQETLISDQQQVDMEGKRQKRGANQPRVQMLQQTLERHTSNAEALKSLFDKACKGIFYQRYRDSVQPVRELCMEELGEWMLTFPERFVDDTYLKYLGWTLNDKEPAVRKKCLQVILPLYEREDLTPKLQLFSNKFKDRFVDMTADQDLECCIKAVKILCALDKAQSELFGDRDLDRLFELIYVNDRALAVAAADFLLGRMNAVAVTDPDRKKGRKFRSGKVWSEDTWNIYEIVKFFAESPTHKHSAYLVDSLIDACPALTAWEAMTSLLLEEPAEGEPVLSDRHECILIELMCWAVKHSATGDSPIGRTGAKKTKTSKEKTDAERSRLTRHFISTLPALLSKFKQDMKKTMLLISVPQFFEVEEYTKNHKDEELDQLLDVVVELFTKSEEDALLRNCAKTIEALSKEGTGIVNRIAMARSTLAESVVASLQESLPSWLAGANLEVVYAFETSVARLVALLTFSDLPGSVELWDDLMTVVRRGLAPDSDVKRALLRKVMLCCYLTLLWRILALRRPRDGAGPPEVEECEAHVRRVQEFVGCLMGTLVTDQTANETVFAACQNLLDLLVQHPGTDVKAADWQARLRFQLSEVDQTAITEFVEFQVFGNTIPETTSADARLCIIHKRRLLLTQFCRALTCNVISARYAATIFKNYISSDADYSDIIKEAVKKMLDSSRRLCADAVAAALIDLYTQQIRSLRRSGKEILEIRDVAKRFALLFGTDLDKCRLAMGTLHKSCVEFIKSAQNKAELAKRVLFFDVLLEFATKLRKDDKARLVHRLDSLPNLPGELKGDVLIPFMQYRNMLAGAASSDDTDAAADKHRRGRRVNPHVPKHAPLRIPTPEAEPEPDSEAHSMVASAGVSGILESPAPSVSDAVSLIDDPDASSRRDSQSTFNETNLE